MNATPKKPFRRWPGALRFKPCKECDATGIAAFDHDGTPIDCRECRGRGHRIRRVRTPSPQPTTVSA